MDSNIMNMKSKVIAVTVAASMAMTPTMAFADEENSVEMEGKPAKNPELGESAKIEDFPQILSDEERIEETEKDMNEKADIVDETKEELETATKELEEAVENYQVAESNVREAENNKEATDKTAEEAFAKTVEDAEKDVATKEIAVAEAEAAAWAAQNEYVRLDDAYIDANDEYERAKAAFEEAQEAYPAAQTQLENDEKAVHEAEKRVEEAQAELNAAREANGEYDSLTTVVEQKERDLVEAQSAKKTADRAKEIAEQNLADAVTKVDNAETVMNAAQEKADAAAAELEATGKALEAARTQYEREKTAVDQAVEAAQKAMSDTGRAYIESKCAEGMTISDWEQEMRETGFFDKYMGDKYSELVASALTVENLIKAADFVAEGNSLRALEGVGPLLIDYNLMAIAAISNAISTQTYDHTMFDGVFLNNALSKKFRSVSGSLAAENLAFGYKDPFAGWYTAEKKVYDSNGSGETGHYKNLTDKNYTKTTTGFSVNNRNFSEQLFGNKTGTGVTPEAFKEALSELAETAALALQQTQTARAALDSKPGYLTDAEHNVNVKQAELDNARNASNAQVSAYDKAQTDLKEANDLLEAAKAEASAAKARVEKASVALEEAKTAAQIASGVDVQAAEQALANAKAELKAAADTFEADQEAATEYVATAEALDDSEKKRDAADEATAKAHRDYMDKVHAVDIAKEKLQDAQAEAERASNIDRNDPGTYKDNYPKLVALEQAVADAEDVLVKAKEELTTAYNVLKKKTEAKETAEVRYAAALADYTIAKSVYENLIAKQQAIVKKDTSGTVKTAETKTVGTKSNVTPVKTDRNIEENVITVIGETGTAIEELAESLVPGGAPTTADQETSQEDNDSNAAEFGMIAAATATMIALIGAFAFKRKKGMKKPIGIVDAITHVKNRPINGRFIYCKQDFSATIVLGGYNHEETGDNGLYFCTVPAAADSERGKQFLD